MHEQYCYIIMIANDGDYDHWEEWSDRVFEDLGDAVTYILDELGCEMVSEDTMFFKRRFLKGSSERIHNECSQENGGQSVWIDRRIFIPKMGKGENAVW